MRSLRRIIGTELMVVILLVGLGLSAFAHASDNGSRLEDRLHLKNVTIPWLFSLDSAFCGNRDVGLINPVDNGSDRLRRITREVKADGSQLIVQDDLKKGIAVDDGGTTYQFIYKNSAVFNLSPDLSSVDVHMIDTFGLQGKGFKMSAEFDWTWTYPTVDVAILLEPTADFPVDQFVFATADGVHPDTANGVTNWQQLKTQGDPFNCDPL